MQQIGITATAEQALTLATALSHDAYERLEQLRLPSSIWNDAEAFKRQLKLTFADLKTVDTYRYEFRTAKQQQKEDAGQFLDRVYHLAIKANEPLIGDSPVSSLPWLQASAQQQFCDGLRSKTLRLLCLNNPQSSIADLRAYALRAELNENMVHGRPNSTNDQAKGSNDTNQSQGKSNASQDSPSDDANAKPDSEGKRNRKGGRNRQGDSADKGQKGAGASNAQNGKGQQRSCEWCGGIGHVINDCRTKNRQRNGGNTQADGPPCVRCGRVGHLAARCWATRHSDGSPLSPNGVQPPARYKDFKRPADSNNSNNSNAQDVQPPANVPEAPSAHGLASYQTNLNATRDVAPVAPRPYQPKPNF